ncbi:hypothetical protein BX600DRAFT_249257 [Xylariales sp. PMI_506]|nr:hypothetical protein BX600DRAFT_249257 [Xylariales sp. PMI_506]
MAPFGTLYTLKDRVHSRARKIFAVAALSELELEVFPDFKPGITIGTKEFLEKFPLGKIPTLETASGFTLIESSAIASYIANSGPRREQLVGATAEERAPNQQWVLFNDLQVETTLSELTGWRWSIEDFSEQKEAKAAAKLTRWLDFYENHLRSRVWFVNSDNAGPSLADLTVGATLFLSFSHYVDAELRRK